MIHKASRQAVDSTISGNRVGFQMKPEGVGIGPLHT